MRKTSRSKKLCLPLQRLSSLRQTFKFLLNLNAGVVARFQQLLSEHFESLESTGPGIDFSTVFLQNMIK